mgnify:CR=1 FL=1
MTDKNEKTGTASGEGFNLASILCNGLALLFVAAAVAVVLYQAYGFVTGQGWTWLSVVDAMDWLGLPRPMPTEVNAVSFVTTILTSLPLPLVLLVIGWLWSKLADLFESMS